MSAPTPRECILRTIRRWEGIYGNQTWDPGNWVTLPDGSRRLTGTKFGVTAGALAAHRGVPAWTITADIMKAMPIEEAGDIGESMFYKGTGIDQLPWGPATDVLMDIGWGTGVGQAIKLMQRLVGVAADGRIGPLTIAAYSRWLASVGWEKAVREMHRIRMDFYRMLGRQNPAAYGPPQPGWKNRADWMLPEGLKDKPGEWWAHWKDNIPPLPAVADKPPAPLPADKLPPAAATPAPPSSVVEKVVTVVSPLAPVGSAFLAADWKVVAIIAGMVLAGLLLWRLHRRDQQVQS